MVHIPVLVGQLKLCTIVQIQGEPYAIDLSERKMLSHWYREAGVSARLVFYPREASHFEYVSMLVTL